MCIYIYIYYVIVYHSSVSSDNVCNHLSIYIIQAAAVRKAAQALEEAEAAYIVYIYVYVYIYIYTHTILITIIMISITIIV